MYASLFIASGSFFLGQMQFLPDWVTANGIHFVLALAPLVLMLIYLAVVRIPRRRKQATAAA